MANKVDLEKPRRNLLIFSCLLIFIELAGVKINGASIPGLSLTVQKPELIIPFLWIVLAYSAWHFWLIAKPNYQPFSNLANKHTNRIPHVLVSVTDQGFNIAGSMGEHYPSIKRCLFRRYAEFNPRDASGGFSPERQTIRLTYIKMLMPEILGDIKTIATDTVFVEYMLPLLIAGVPVLLFLIRKIFHPLYSLLLS